MMFTCININIKMGRQCKIQNKQAVFILQWTIWSSSMEIYIYKNFLLISKACPTENPS